MRSQNASGLGWVLSRSVVNDFKHDERMSDRWDENKTSFRLRWNEATLVKNLVLRFMAAKSLGDLTFVPLFF